MIISWYFYKFSFKPWRYDREGDTTLLFFLKFLFICLFPHGLKPMRGSNFNHQLMLKLFIARGKRNNKVWFWHDFLYFQIFQIFGNLNRFLYQFKQIFLTNYQYHRSYATFLLKIWHTIKQISSMPLQCRYTRDIV